MRIEFTIPGNPFGKQRPYVVNRHGIKRKESVLHENIAREAWHNEYSGKPFEWSIALDITAYYQIPKSWAKWKQKAARLGYIRPNKKGPSKPDVDNVSKLIMDSLNPTKIGRKTVPNTGIYEDDGQVVHLTIDSYYSVNPRVVVIVTAYEKPDLAKIKEEMKKGE